MKPFTRLFVFLRRSRCRVLIRTKLAFAFSLLLGLIALLIFLYFPHRMERQALQSVAERAESIGVMTAFSAEAGLYFEDIVAVEEAARVARQNADLVYLVITDPAGQVWTSFNPAKAAQVQFRDVASGPISGDEAIYRFAAPVLADSITIGHVYLRLVIRKGFRLASRKPERL